MKQIATFFLSLLLLAATAANIHAQGLEYYVDVFEFQSADGTPYLEIQTNIDGKSMSYVQNENGKFQGEVEITLFIQKDGAEEQADAIRVLLTSEELDDTSETSIDVRIMDVRKFPMKPGKYNLIGNLVDLKNLQTKNNAFEKEIIISDPIESGPKISDVIFVKKFEKTSENIPHAKYGYEVLPINTGDFYENQEQLGVYCELYNVNKFVEDQFFVHTFITEVNAVEKLSKYQHTVKKTAKALDIFYTQFDITELPSQTYYLNIEIFNGRNEIIASTTRKFFQYNTRISVDVSLNPRQFDEDFGLTEEELSYFIPTLYSISTNSEQDFSRALKTYEEKQNYFINYWEKRRVATTDHVAKAWKVHEKKVEYANDKYKSAFKDGWKTDRGRVLMVYGPANDIQFFPGESWKFPYEIWTYNKVGTQSNVIFVFYDADRATEDYTLLHSTRFGEVNNPRYELDLLRRTTQQGNLDRNTDSFDTNEKPGDDYRTGFDRDY